MLEIANDYITSINQSQINELTINKDYGYVIFFTSKKYYETGDDKYAVVGNGPFLVENKTGKVVQFGTAMDVDYYLEEYENGRWPNNRRLDF